MTKYPLKCQSIFSCTSPKITLCILCNMPLQLQGHSKLMASPCVDTIIADFKILGEGLVKNIEVLSPSN